MSLVAILVNKFPWRDNQFAKVLERWRKFGDKDIVLGQNIANFHRPSSQVPL